MISCKHCLTANSLDSTFCKHCGKAMPEAEVSEAKEKLEELVQTGFDLLKEGRSDEAMIIAENAASSNPSSPAALSLKAMCHEGRGEAAEALECYEQVVALKPDSALDKIKVNQLRNLMVAKAVEAPVQPDRRGAMLVAASITALVIAGGLFLIRSMSHPATQVATNLVATPQPLAMVQGFDAAQTPAAVATPSPSPAATQPQASPALTTPDPATQFPKYNGSTLPAPGSDDGDVPPIKVEPPSGTGFRGAGPTPAPSRPTHDGVIVDPPKTSPSPSVRTDPGQINITVHGQRPPSGSSAPDRENGLQALLGAARSNFQLGHWSEAARNYEEAISQGGGRASNFQHLGDCYRHLGQNGKAVDALTRAADAYEASGNAAGADSCRQAIKLLKGG